MDKVKKYLELYVEWLALALGGAFLLWMVYVYVVSKPVSVAVGSNPAMTPGEIDQRIWEDKGKPLQDQVNSTAVPANLPKVTDIVAQVRSRLQDTQQYAMAGPYTPLTLGANGAPSDEAPANPQQGDQVTSLPVPPPIVDLKISRGHSNVPAPLPAGQVANADNGPLHQVLAVDKSWLTVSGRIPVADLVKALDAKKIPAKLYSTAVLRVELIRQERDAAGNWGPDQGIEMPPLSIDALDPLPAVNASSNMQRDYQDWAEKNAMLIMEPPFYQVLQGDIWYVPGTKNPNEVQLQIVAFDPTTFKGDPGTLSPEDRKVWDAYKLKLRLDAAAAAAARRGGQNRYQPQPTTPSPYDINNDGGPGGGNNNGGNNGGRLPGGRGSRRTSGLADDPQRRDMAQVSPGGYPNTMNGQIPGQIIPGQMIPGQMIPGQMIPGQMIPGQFPGQYPGQFPGGGYPGQTFDQARPTADTAAAAAAAATVPQGSFDPRKQLLDIQVWAHDDTVQAGKTYRYMLRYKISNPVARSVGLCNPQALATQFYITSDDKAAVWTDPISVESDTNFYATKVNPSKNEVSFDVFHWKDGVWQLQTVKVTPGDMVGGVDPASGKTDFTTGWTLVDVRTDPRDESVVTIVLASDNGTVLRKDPNIDMRNAEYHKLLEQVKEQQAKDTTKTAAAQ